MIMGGTSLFSLNNVSFQYAEKPFFKNLTFTMDKGRFYGLIGPNGGGKSTLINLLMGIQRPSEGHILYKNRDLNSYKRRELAREISLVPQRITLGFDYTVKELVLMGRHPHMPRFSRPSAKDWAKVDEALHLLDIHHLRNRPAIKLSGGEQQRVIVARALAQDTEIIMLDEATSNLDIAHTIEIMQVLRQKVDHSSSTIVAAIHDLNLAAAFCDAFIVLKSGEIYRQGPVKEILTSDLLQEVFTVEGSVICNGSYPRIEFQLHASDTSSNTPTKR